MKSYNSRKEVPDKYKWDLTDLCASEEDFDRDIKVIAKEIKTLSKYKGCTKNADKLLEYLNNELDIFSRFENLLIFAYLNNDIELGNPKSIERLNLAINYDNELSKNTAFFAPELLKLSKDEYKYLFEKNSGLNEYRKYLDLIFRDKEHSLSENEEIIVSELVNSANHYEDMSSTLISSEHNYGKVLVDGQKETIAVNNYYKLLKNKDSKIRKKVYTLFNKKINEYSTTNASLLNGYVSMQTALSRIYKFPSSWEHKMFNLNMPTKAFDTLRLTTEKNVSSLQKFMKLKKKVLGLDTLHPYDLYVVMSNSNEEYTIEQAQDVLLECIKPLGEDYTKHFNKIFDNHYIDYCQYKGKTAGAYSCSTTTNDSRILMSYNGDLDAISTIAHEGGHNVHHQYVKENNIPIYRGITSLVAEVASLTNEFLLSDYISKNAKTKSERLHGLENIINVIENNLFGAVREGKIEQDMYQTVHKGGTITKEYMDKLSRKSLKYYYGDTVKFDKLAYCDWVRRSHYYVHFYLYDYAICVSIASNVASEILKGNKEMLNNYFKFLKTGGDVWPIDSFKTLGIDVTDSKVYENAIKYFDELVDKYEKIYNDKEV